MFSRVFVLRLYFGLAKHIMMLSLLESDDMRVSMCDFRLLFLFMVSPSIMCDATFLC